MRATSARKSKASGETGDGSPALATDRVTMRNVLLFLGLGTAAAAFACSSGGTTSSSSSGGAPSESHASAQQNGACTSKTDVLPGHGAAGSACQTYADCAPVCCSCARSSGGFSAAACVGGVCVAGDVACPLAKKDDHCPGDPPVADGGPLPDGATPVEPGTDAGPVTSSFCVAFTGSHATDRQASRLAAMKQLVTDLATATGNGTLNVIRDGAGRPTSIDFSASGSAENYHVTITYDAAGNVTNLRRSWSGSTQDDTHLLSYDAQGQLSTYRLTWSGSSPTETETYSYDGARRLSVWRHTWSDSQPTETETLTYDADGYLSTWRRSWSNAQPTENETFTYDGSHRLTSWHRVWSDSTPTETVTLSYSGSSTTPSTTSTSGPVPGGARVVSCVK
jgi:YD repeat-containing protein